MSSAKRLFFLGGIVSLGLFLLQCRDVKEAGQDVSTPEVLHDLNSVFEHYERLEKSGRFADLARKISEANRDLESSELYVEAASLYHLAGISDSAIILLHKALDQGMANPSILRKFPGLDEQNGESLTQLSVRLDSLANVLHSPSNFSLETRAMDQFWPYFEKAKSNPDSAKQYLKAYVLEGPPEIKDYYAIRYYNVDNMYGQMINGAPQYYDYLRAQLSNDSLMRLKDETTKAMKNFKSLYPQAVFPKVFVVPGLLNSGGTASEMGLFIGGDMYGRSENMPVQELSEWQKGAIMEVSSLPQLILHELMHFQQNYTDQEHKNSVLYKVIEEGVCDFLSELSSGVPIKSEQLEYLDSPENLERIMEELKQELYSEDLSQWMYNGGSIEDRPPDLGYALGYLITKSYYRNAPDKKRALANLVNTQDMESILKGSDYGYILNSQPSL